MYTTDVRLFKGRNRLSCPVPLMAALAYRTLTSVAIEPGTRVVVRDALGAELLRVALSRPTRGEDFPVVLVCRPEEWDAAHAEGRDPQGVPWPREDVTEIESAPAT